MAQSIGEVALLGQALVLDADVHGVALLSAGGSNCLTLVPGLLQNRNVLGVGVTANGTGKGLDALLIDSRSLGDNTLVIAVGQLGGVVSLVSQTRNLVALIDGIAFAGAGCRNDFLDMVGLVQRRNLFGTGLAAVLALEGLDTVLGVGSRLGNDAVIPVVALGSGVVVVIVHAAPLVADMLVIPAGGAGSLMVANNKGVGRLSFLFFGCGRGCTGLLNGCLGLSLAGAVGRLLGGRDICLVRRGGAADRRISSLILRGVLLSILRLRLRVRRGGRAGRILTRGGSLGRSRFRLAGSEFRRCNIAFVFSATAGSGNRHCCCHRKSHDTLREFGFLTHGLLSLACFKCCFSSRKQSIFNVRSCFRSLSTLYQNPASIEILCPDALQIIHI